MKENRHESNPLLSVIVPCYNEAETIEQIIGKVAALDLGISREIVVVDDGSTDDTPARLSALAAGLPFVTMITHPVNRGKGAAVRAGFSRARGNIICIQDADLEYNPADLSRLLEPILDNRADVVFGSRFVGGESHRVLYFWHSVANRFLTLCCNLFSNLNLTDMEVCYKAFRREIVEKLRLRENRFGFEPEVTLKVSRLNCRIYEVGISYAGRTFVEGKKISWKDGVRALYVIVKYGLFRLP